MTLAVFALLVWIALTLILLCWHATTLAALWREPVLTRPVVVVESDDWGPGPVSDAQMLERIAGLLADIRDTKGRPAVMTLGVVLGKPDGAAILANDCRQYHRRALDEPRYAPIVEAIGRGCGAGVFTLQRHGLEHCWPSALLARARSATRVHEWLADDDARSEALPPELQSRWIDAAELPSSPLPADDVLAAVEQEAEMFRRIFGEVPTVAVPNTFVWTDDVERAWASTGVSCVVTCGRQYVGRAADGSLLPPVRQMFNGAAGVDGIRYVVRDAYFEPIRGHRAEQVWAAVAERTELGRPTLLEMHRESFVAGAEAAERALAELERALRGVLRRHPDVHFMSTAALHRLLPAATPLQRRSGLYLLRIVMFARRVLATSGLSRSLKLTGLYFVLIPLENLLARVTPIPSDDRLWC